MTSTPEQAIYITDMSRCQPAQSLSDKNRKNHWRLIPYEAEDVQSVGCDLQSSIGCDLKSHPIENMSGVMLEANSTTQAPEVSLPLGVSGWHAVYLGFWNAHHAYDGGAKIKLKLAGDPCFQTITDSEPPITWDRSVLKETFVRYADLTGKDLLIAQQNKGKPQKACIAYIKLLPLSDSEVLSIQEDRSRTDTRMLYSLNDGNGLFYNGPVCAEDLIEEVELYRYSDVKAVLFAATCGDLVNYPSKVSAATYVSDEDSTIPTESISLFQSFTTLREKGIVPIKVLSEHVHEMGLDFHAQFRMGILGDIPPSELWGRRGLVGRRPDLRMVDKDGTAVEKASYAFPEVREYMLSLIREVAETYDVDGINLCFVRGPMFVGYEDIVIQDFTREYGVDPRTLEENDIRAQLHRASYVNTLVRDAKKLVDEVGAKKGRKIELSAVVYDGAQDLFFGLDILTWLNEGLLDSIFMVYDPKAGLNPAVANAIKSSGCKLIMQLFSSTLGDEGSPLAVQAVTGHEYGMDGFWYWDMNFAHEMPEYWDVLRRIGHKDEAREFAEHRPKMKLMRVKSVAGCDISHTTNRGTPEWPPEMLHVYSGG